MFFHTQVHTMSVDMTVKPSFHDMYPNGLFNLVKSLVKERKKLARKTVMEEEKPKPPLKKRKFDVITPEVTSSTGTKRRRKESSKYYVPFERDVIQPQYRVTLYDRFVVLHKGLRSGLIVKLHHYEIDHDNRTVLWTVSEGDQYDDIEYWQEQEDNLELL